MTATSDEWLTDAEQRAWRSYLRAQALLVARLDAEMRRRTGCTLGDYEVLVHLSEAPGGRLRQRELADALQWEKSRLSHQLTRMERRGFVRRSADPADRRGVSVSVTAAGKRAIRAAAPAHAADVRALFADVLTPRQLDALRVASERILEALDPEE